MSNPIPEAEKQTYGGSLNLYHWKGSDIKPLLAAGSIPYVPVYTGNTRFITRAHGSICGCHQSPGKKHPFCTNMHRRILSLSLQD